MLSVIRRFNERFTARQRAVLFVLALVLFLCVSAAVAKAMNNSSALMLNVPKADAFESTPLIALDSGAKSKILYSKGTYKFTQKQLTGIKTYLSGYNDGALTLVVRNESKDAKGKFSFGLFYDAEHTDNMDLLPIVASDMAKSQRYRLTLSFGKDKEGNVAVPFGFFAKSECAVVIEEALITRAAMGFDKSGDTPHFAFASTGGNADMARLDADFSGGSSLFPTQNGLAGSAGGKVMPKIIIKLDKMPEEKCTLGFGGERFTLWKSKGDASESRYTLTCYAAALKMPFNIVRAEGAAPAAIMMVSSEEMPVQDAAFGNPKVLTPYKTDPGFIISWPEETWRTRDYELFEWDRFPKVLFMDFRNYEVQSAFLRRLAFFTEKKGYRGRLASDEELKDKHDYNAHDYSAQSLAAFYDRAKAEDFPLNESEMLLLDILLQNEIIKLEGTHYVALLGALISISKQSEPWLRDRLLSHEGWHGVYFTNERFRNAVAAVYGTIDGRSRDFLEQYWGTQEGLGYDTTDEYLTQNEFMAYLMQQRLSDTASYFVHLANRGSVMRGIPELAQYVRETGGIAFEDAARFLDEYAADNFGLACGRISLIRK